MSAKWSSQPSTKSGTPDFADLLKKEYVVVLLQGKNVFGDMIYCYVKVAVTDVDRLQMALKADANFNASDYGTIVAAGKGYPTEEVRKEIGTTYPMLAEPKPMTPPPVTIPAEKKAWDEY